MTGTGLLIGSQTAARRGRRALGITASLLHRGDIRGTGNACSDVWRSWYFGDAPVPATTPTGTGGRRSRTGRR